MDDNKQAPPEYGQVHSKMLTPEERENVANGDWYCSECGNCQVGTGSRPSTGMPRIVCSDHAEMDEL